MIPFDEYMPSAIDEPFIAETDFGTRTVVMCSRMGFFRYIDCTHPMQNCHCNPFDIIRWEYVDKSKMNQLLFKESWVGRRKRIEQADKMLDQIKLSFWDRLSIKFKLYFGK